MCSMCTKTNPVIHFAFSFMILKQGKVGWFSLKVISGTKVVLVGEKWDVASSGAAAVAAGRARTRGEDRREGTRR